MMNHHGNSPGYSGPPGPSSGAEEPKEGAQSRVFYEGDTVVKVAVPPEKMLGKALAHPWFREKTIEDMKVQYWHGIEHHRSVERYLSTNR